MRARVERARHHLPAFIALVLFWMLLWGTLSWANLLSGAAVALTVGLLLPLPPLRTDVRFHPLGVLVFVGRFAADLMISSWHVVLMAFRPGRPSSAIISVQARSDNDLLLTLLSEALCLVPGSIVIDLDRPQRLVSLHVIDAKTPEDVAEQKRKVLAQEARIIRAFGSPELIAELDRPVAATGTTGGPR